MLAKKGVGNPITDQKLIDAIAPQIEVDNGLSTSTMLELMDDFHSANINTIPQYTLPVASPGFGTYYYGGVDMGDIVFPVEQTDQQIIDKFLGASSSTDTMNGKPLPEPQTILVNVVNGSGVTGQALVTSDDLQKLGFVITGTPTTVTPVSDQAQETIVYYARFSN